MRISFDSLVHYTLSFPLVHGRVVSPQDEAVILTLRNFYSFRWLYLRQVTLLTSFHAEWAHRYPTRNGQSAAWPYRITRNRIAYACALCHAVVISHFLSNISSSLSHGVYIYTIKASRQARNKNFGKSEKKQKPGKMGIQAYLPVFYGR